mmetsp:Transcript_27063/g.81954  ORF Transcript_27063/g.81954 Transcript_27063/m.81954 type:complete len:159 (+) Transcript_27063:2309-2785(+)
MSAYARNVMRPVSTRTLDHGVHSAVRYMHAVFITTTSWPQIRPLIVEVKNRVRRVSTPPPFYDVVQAVTYCRMVGCDAADLVQALNDKIHISRIELDGPPMWHGAAWDNHVLPRLRAFATAVQKFRADTKLRASYLCGDERWRAKLLRDHGCGFLLHH